MDGRQIWRMWCFMCRSILYSNLLSPQLHRLPRWQAEYTRTHLLLLGRQSECIFKESYLSNSGGLKTNRNCYSYKKHTVSDRTWRASYSANFIYVVWKMRPGQRWKEQDSSAFFQKLWLSLNIGVNGRGAGVSVLLDRLQPKLFVRLSWGSHRCDRNDFSYNSM